MIRIISTLGLAAALIAGCGSSDDTGRPPAAKSTAAASTSPTPAPIEVSDATTCAQLFNNTEPLNATADIVIKFSKTEVINDTDLDVAEIRDLSDTMKDIASRASDALAPSLNLMVTKLDKIADLVENPTAETVQLSDFQAAGYEVTNICQKYPAAVVGS